MKIVKVRSPFIIEVADQGSTHIGSKIILTIWNDGQTEPTLGQDGYYVSSKSNPSATQKKTYYNVSNYVKEFITNIKSSVAFIPQAQAENPNEWCKFRVKKYWYNGTTYTELSNELYFGVNGFLDYTNGYQNPTTTKLELLANPNINNYVSNWYSYWGSKEECLNVFYNKLSTETFTIKWTFDGATTVTQNISNGVASSGNLKVPVGLLFSATPFQKCVVEINLNNDYVISFNTYSVCETKYIPVRCSFVNRYGGWKEIIFFKAQANSVAIKGTDYKLTQNAINYNTAIGQFKTFNINGKQTIKLNTGWVDENYSELITDLLLSETVLLDDKPVTVKTQGSDLKTILKDKNINYEIEFEYAYNLINDII